MSHLGSHRTKAGRLRIALALFAVLGLFASGAVPAALADDGGDDECSSSFDGGFVVLDDDCHDDGDDGGDDADMASSGSRGGRYRLEIITASCTFSASGTSYDVEVRAGRTLRQKTATLRLLDVTSGTSVLAATKPAPGRLIDLEGSVAKKVGRMGLGLVDASGHYLKLVTVRCTAA